MSESFAASETAKATASKTFDKAADIASDTVTAARDRAEDLLDQTSEAVERGASMFSDGPPILKEWVAVVQEGFERNVAALDAMQKSRSAQEVLQIQTDWLRESALAFSETGRRLAEASVTTLQSAQKVTIPRTF